MKCTEQELIKNLKEMHEYYWNLGKKLHASDSKNPNHAYETGKADGALEALNAIMLSVIGGEEMYKFLESHWNND